MTLTLFKLSLFEWIKRKMKDYDTIWKLFLSPSQAFIRQLIVEEGDAVHYDFASNLSTPRCLVYLIMKYGWCSICPSLSNKETVCCLVPCCVCLASFSIRLDAAGLQPQPAVWLYCITCWFAFYNLGPSLQACSVSGCHMYCISALSYSAPLSQLSNLLCVFSDRFPDLWITAQISELFSGSNTLSRQFIGRNNARVLQWILPSP